MTDNRHSPDTPVIEMHGIGVPSARKPTAVAIRNVEWQVAENDYWLIAGLEGSGRTSLLTMTAGLVAPLEGTYRLFGQPMPIFEGEQFATRLRLGMVFDDGRLFNHLTVEENVALPLRYHGKLSVQEINDTAMGILDWMELRPWTANTPGTLAWSWQKRAALARAIALRPEVLLLDDPLLGLDARHASWWLNILDQLSKGCDWTKGRAVTLIVTAGTLNTWKDRARQFAVLGNNQFKVLGSRERVTESVETLAEDFLSGTVNS